MSDSYRALTRTYRPRTFDEIVSQEHVSDTLRNAIKKNRLAHAYMFCGPRGVGKTTMARVLARTVNEIDPDVDGESLDQTLNVVEIDAASNNSVDDIRDLREKVRIPPQNGRYKIYIIDEVHMLSKSAFNALLKTLEEPPDHIIFIFATTEPHKVLPTILSRVQRFDFKRLRMDEIVDHLEKVASEEEIRLDRESLHVIAKKADGALRDALGLLDQAIAFCGSDIRHDELLRALNVVSTDRMFQVMETVGDRDAERGLELIHELLQEGYDIQEFLVGLTEHLRNLYVAKTSKKMHLVEASSEMKDRYRESGELFSEDDLLRMLHVVSEAQFKIKEAQQPKIQFEITLLKLIHMERTRDLNTLLRELEELKKKFTEKKRPVSSGEPSAESETGKEPETKQTDSRNTAPAESGGSAPSPSSTDQAAPSAASENPPKEQPEQAETAVKEVNEEQSESEAQPENGFFGEPSLGGSAGASNGSARRSEPEGEGGGVPSRAPGDLTVGEIGECWETFLEDLRQHVPQTLYFQMQRLEPVKIRNRDLVLRCSDDFAKQVVEENKRSLGKILEQHTGAYLNFTCRVRKSEAEEEESHNPYERFKKLQERDPKIRKLVELFGAELDYNLNQ